MMVHWDRLSTGVGAGATSVDLGGLGIAGCFAGAIVAVGDGFSGSTDSLSRVPGVADAMAHVVVCSTLAGVDGFNSSVSSAGWQAAA